MQERALLELCLGMKQIWIEFSLPRANIELLVSCLNRLGQGIRCFSRIFIYEHQLLYNFEVRE